MKTIKQKNQKTQRSFCCLAREEHSDLTLALFMAESAVRVVSERCFAATPLNAEMDQQFVDIGNILEMAEDKLRFAQRVLDK